MKIFPMSLKTISNVNPTILNGSRTNQTRGKRNIIRRAKGQQTTSSKHHKASAINVLIPLCYTNCLPAWRTLRFNPKKIKSYDLRTPADNTVNRSVQCTSLITLLQMSFWFFILYNEKILCFFDIDGRLFGVWQKNRAGFSLC